MSPASESEATLPPEDPAIRRPISSGPDSGPASAKPNEVIEVPEWLFWIDRAFAMRLKQRLAQNKCGHRAVVCGGMDVTDE